MDNQQVSPGPKERPDKKEAKPAPKKQQHVFVTTFEEYDRSISDWGREQIIGVFGSVEKANAAARNYMDENVGGSGSEKDGGDEREESLDSEGCISIHAEDVTGQQYSCSVNRFAVE